MSPKIIPMSARVRIESQSGRGISLWLPLFLLWLVLLPLVLLAFPFFLMGCLFTWINPLRTLQIFWEILSAFKGTHVAVTNAGMNVQITIG